MLFTASDLASITSDIHNWILFLLWLHIFILSGVISPLISRSILGSYRPGEFIIQCPIFLPFHTVHGVLRQEYYCRIVKTQKLCCPRDSQESFPAPQFESINSSVCSLLHGPNLISIHPAGKTIALIIQTFVGKVKTLLFNPLSRFVIAFLPRSKHGNYP